MRKSLLRLILVLIVVIAAVACDQSTKHFARTSLRNTGTIRIIGDFFVLRYAENKGAFLSLGSNWPLSVRSIVFGALALFAVFGAAIYVIWQKQMNLLQTILLSLVIGGGIGNLLDRWIHGGYVTDFMNIGIGKVRTGIFNVADVFLMVGVVLFVLIESKKKVK